MSRVLLWMQYIRSVVLALRVIAFEKTDEATLGVWAVLALPVTAVLFLTASVFTAAAALGIMTLLFFVFRRWTRRNRFRLVRVADRVEYADTTTAESDFRQRFLSGVILRRMGIDDIKRTGEYDPETMSGDTRFFLVRSRTGTRIIPAELIVGIEIDGLED